MTNSTQETVSNSPDLVAIASSAVRQGLIATHELHERLGEVGLTEVQKNEYGDTAMKLDIESEATIIKLLESLNLHTQVHSEEHGDFEIGDRATQIGLTAAIDGLDGSGVYKKERGKGRYGTMFALFSGQSPNYGDYLAAGVMEHAIGKLYLAVKDKGLDVVDVQSNVTTEAKVNNHVALSHDSTIYVDSAEVGPDNLQYAEYYGKNKVTFADPLNKAGYIYARLGSSAIHFVDLATGRADLVGESTRKGNLEFATAYALVHESGGVMVSIDGKDIGNQPFNEFGQHEHIPIMAAPNMTIVQHVIDLIKG